MNFVAFRPMKIEDIDQVMEIENLSFIDPWKKDEFVSEFLNNEFSNIYVGEISTSDNKKRIVCFYDYWVTFDTATISQLATHPDFRKSGIGSMMMKNIIDDCYAKRVITITLEVRTHNEKAINLYKKFGFEQELIKSHYYKNGDDALYMIKEVFIYG